MANRILGAAFLAVAVVMLVLVAGCGGGGGSSGGDGGGGGGGGGGTPSCSGTSAGECAQGTYGYPTTHSAQISSTHTLLTVDGTSCAFVASRPNDGTYCTDTYSCGSASHSLTWGAHSYPATYSWTLDSSFVTCSGGGGGGCAGRCSSCLDSCRGYSGCCCGSGCMCESECTSSCGDNC